MAAQVAVQLDEDVFRELQQRAEPLVDDISAVLRRLLADSRVDKADVPDVREVTLARGERLPVGLHLRAIFRDRRFEAVVTEDGILFDGKAYDSLSAAARAAKACAGVSEKAAQTNGWKFWEYLDVRRGNYELAERLRDGTGEFLRRGELTILGIGNSGYTDTSMLATEPAPPVS